VALGGRFLPDKPLNYRHAFHAGNFADLVKHAAVLHLLASRRSSAPLTVIDTHGGAGMYDLLGPEAVRSGEAEAGIGRLLADDAAPAEFDALKAAVRAANEAGEARLYPGSPWLISRALRRGDRLIACELRPDDYAVLRQVLADAPGAEAVKVDGYDTARRRSPQEGPALVLIDPPFERADDYARCAGAVRDLVARNPRAVIVVWLPLKDLETFDAFLRSIETAPTSLLVAEARLRPLTDPMRMNGCALVVANPPPGLADHLTITCDWLAQAAGEGGEGRVWSLA
jgi:23S rRNA (adenine2030-N6)-methyltransferase